MEGEGSTTKNENYKIYLHMRSNSIFLLSYCASKSSLGDNDSALTSISTLPDLPSIILLTDAMKPKFISTVGQRIFFMLGQPRRMLERTFTEYQ